MNITFTVIYGVGIWDLTHTGVLPTGGIIRSGIIMIIGGLHGLPIMVDTGIIRTIPVITGDIMGIITTILIGPTTMDIIPSILGNGVHSTAGQRIIVGMIMHLCPLRYLVIEECPNRQALKIHARAIVYVRIILKGRELLRVLNRQINQG